MAKRRNRWYKDAVIYQIYPRSFMDSNGDGIGDLQGIISKVDYIKSLGVDAVWLSPIYKSPNDDNGYDISDYESIMDEFGSIEDCRKLIEAFHSRGIKVIMDLVVNHTSDEHHWFKEARKDEHSPYRNYYYFYKAKGKKKNKMPNNWTSLFGGSAWEYNKDTDDYYLHLFSKKQPDLNYNNEKVLQEVIDIINFWGKEGVDGFRCDVINMLSKENRLPYGKGHIALVGKEYYLNGPHIHEILHEMNVKGFAKYDMMTVGEAVLMTKDIAPLYVKEDREELDMLFSFDHQDADNHLGIKYLIKKFNLVQYKHTQDNWQRSMDGVGWLALYLENHDQPRSIGRFNTTSDPKYRVLCGKMLATQMMFHKGTPYIYQGEEIGMTNDAFSDVSEIKDREAVNMLSLMPKLGIPKPCVKRMILKRTRDLARTPMQWDDSNNAGFTSGNPWLKVNPNYSSINVKQAESDPDSILNYYRKLIKIRKGNKTIINGDYKQYYQNSKSIYVYSRKFEHEVLLVISNFTNKEQKFELMNEFKNKPTSLVIDNTSREADINNLKLLPYEVRVYSIKV